MSSEASLEDLRRWIDNQRAVEERQREEARDSGYIADPIAAALDLIAFDARLHGWPIPRNPLQEREDEAARETWSRLREALGHR